MWLLYTTLRYTLSVCPCACPQPHARARTHTHSLPSWCNRKHYGRVSQRYRFESRRGQWALFFPHTVSSIFRLSLTHTHTHTHTCTRTHTNAYCIQLPLKITSYHFLQVVHHNSGTYNGLPWVFSSRCVLMSNKRPETNQLLIWFLILFFFFFLSLRSGHAGSVLLRINPNSARNSDLDCDSSLFVLSKNPSSNLAPWSAIKECHQRCHFQKVSVKQVRWKI